MRLQSLFSTERRTYGTDAVVTGSGSGIGRAFALELNRRGGRVVCADRDLVSAQETVASIAESGGNAFAVQCDVSDAEQVRDLASTAERWFGNTTRLLINNAGIGAGGKPIGESSLTDWRQAIEVNLFGVIHGCQTFVPLFRERNCGGVINIASAASFVSAPRMGPYSASKAGVLSISETLSSELAGTGIVVTVACPSMVKTNLADSEAIDAVAAQRAKRLMNLIGATPESVAHAILNAHDRGNLHVLPQIDARLVWRIKRAIPGPYTRALGLVEQMMR
ncbi:SDR family NAD(P)-dependent oxidoreductase [Hoyosella subflava]|uniref:Putative short-chain dehydrogenase/reductase n=1 Tax=Hoyosella subflava (strain DSM 45089 / JCM 17490 / NBRC 109087 / DQS3-9A1) TaxID=443218 RepID=F6ERN6_HOYSD|nr:SDR family NAD(P)-dependent oxidoreductase [Hoyosella subflava]AEF39613.1 putative short-chain dehydrogenase/reductase [Hoyosella subflava DQS3-9A1]